MTLSKQKLKKLGASLIGRKAKDASTLAKIEKMFDVELPQAYKNALVEFGGGIFFAMGASFTSDDEIPLQRPDGTIRLTMLFGLGRGKHSILENMGVFKGHNIEGTAVIGDSPGGNFVLADEYGKVFFWDHEIDRISLVARSLDEFFSRLEPDPAG